MIGEMALSIKSIIVRYVEDLLSIPVILALG